MFSFPDKFGMILESYKYEKNQAKAAVVELITYTLEVGGAQSLAEMIGWLRLPPENVNQDIVEKNFPIVSAPKGSREITLFRFKAKDDTPASQQCIAKLMHEMTKEEILDIMKQFEKRAAGIDELIALGVKLPEIRDALIPTALGSVAFINGLEKAVCLSNASRTKHLDAPCLSTISVPGPWSAEFIFAAVSSF